MERDHYVDDEAEVLYQLVAAMHALTDLEAAALGTQVLALAAEGDALGFTAQAAALGAFGLVLSRHAELELDRFHAIIDGSVDGDPT